MANAWKIGDTTLPSPTSVSPEVTDLYGEETGRDEAGFNHLDLIRAGVKKWTLRFEMLTRKELNDLEAALNPLGFQFTGFHSGNWVTVTSCYGNLTGQELAAFFGDGEEESYWNCQLAIIEN